MTGPLAGIKVIDLSQIVSGPMAAALLADQGAKVIKVESPGGDPVRGLGPAKGDLSAMFIAVNRGKQGLSIDLKTAGGAHILERLIASADVVIDNFRPGTMERLGFGYDRCRAINTRIIYAAITGFGTDGPYTNIRVYDPVVQAVSGIAATQPGPEGRPSLVRTLVADKVTALTMAQAITAALFHRERSGAAQRVDVAMLDAALAFNWPEGMYNHSFIDAPPALFPEYGALSRLWPCADGQVAIGMMQDIEFIALAKSLGRDDLAADKRFHTVGGRMQYRAEWAPAIAAEVARRTKDQLMGGFIREGAVGGRVNSCAETLDDPQVVHNAVVVAIDHGAAGRVRGARPAAVFSATPAVAAGPAPRLGEHGAAVLADLGFDAAEVAAFVADRVVFGVG
jgi:crotonobetainyl-CoA:carnitine CoA-transferase CaiB-like acyl-CoA transferase